MDSVTRILFFYALLSLVELTDTLVLVRAPSPTVVTMGKQPLSLECSYRVTGSEIVLSVNWYRKTASEDDFQLIAQIPKQNPELPPKFTDQHVASRGKIDVVQLGFLDVVKLVISPADCTDEGTYECEVRVYGDKTAHMARMQVRLNEDPLVSSLTHDPNNLVENKPVTFTCIARMGRPQGSFRWLVYTSRTGSSIEEVEMSGITTFRRKAGSCSPTGTSTLAIMVTSADQKVKCIVEQKPNEEILQVSSEKEVDVKYKVTDTEIYARVGETDLPLSTEVIVLEGDDVYLACRALGNPNPEFKWSYLPLSGHARLVSMPGHPELTLRHVTANMSGSYVCVSTNYISNVDYSETRSIRVIVKDKTAFERYRRKTEEDSSVEGRALLIAGVVIGSLLFTVFVALLSVMFYRKYSQKSKAKETLYGGVEPSSSELPLEGNILLGPQ